MGTASAVAAMVLGLSWTGWMAGGGGDPWTAELAHNEVIVALVLLCLQISRDGPEWLTRLTTISGATTYQPRDAVMAAGWTKRHGPMPSFSIWREPACQRRTSKQRDPDQSDDRG